MGFLDFLLLLAIAGVCGSIGQAVAGVSRGGCLVSIAVGFIGALLGRIIADKLGLPSLFDVHIGSSTFPVVWSILCSALFVALISLFQRKPSKD